MSLNDFKYYRFTKLRSFKSISKYLKFDKNNNKKLKSIQLIYFIMVKPKAPKKVKAPKK